MKIMRKFKKPEKYLVNVSSAAYREAPWAILENKSGVRVSAVLGYYSRGKKLNVYKKVNGYGKVSIFLNRWVKMSDLTWT